MDVKLLYKNVGFEVPKEYSDFVKYPFSTPKSMPMFAEGGIATRPSIFGEAGPEMAIPLNNRARSRELLERTNQLMGYDTHSVGDFVLNITNHFTGNVDQNTIEQTEKRNGEQFRREFEKFKQQLRRVSMGT